MRTLGARFGFVQRSKLQSASNRSAYQRHRFIQNETKTKTFYHVGERILQSELCLPTTAPSWAYDDSELWDRVAKAERRRDAVEARTLDISLPRHLSDDCYRSISEEVAMMFVRLGLAVQLDIHDATANDGGNNPHVHMLISTRELTSEGFSRRKSSALNMLFMRQRGRWMRCEISRIINEHAKIEGRSTVVQPGSVDSTCLPEPRLMRWIVKTEFGRDLLVHRRQIKELPSLVLKRSELSSELEALEEMIGDLDWMIHTSTNPNWRDGPASVQCNEKPYNSENRLMDNFQQKHPPFSNEGVGDYFDGSEELNFFEDDLNNLSHEHCSNQDFDDDFDQQDIDEPEYI